MIPSHITYIIERTLSRCHMVDVLEKWQYVVASHIKTISAHKVFPVFYDYP